VPLYRPMPPYLSSTKFNFVSSAKFRTVKSLFSFLLEGTSSDVPLNWTGRGGLSRIGNLRKLIEYATFVWTLNFAENGLLTSDFNKMTKDGSRYKMPSSIASLNVHTSSLAKGNPRSFPCILAMQSILYDFDSFF
jgi:hypothetical protein